MIYNHHAKINNSPICLVPMKRIILFLLLPTILLVGTSLSSGGGKDLKIGKKIPLGTKMMDGVDGTQKSLDELFESNGLVVVFSCNTCPFVVGGDKFPGWEVQYNDLNSAAKKANLGFVLVNSNEAKRDGVDALSEMKTRAEAQGYKMPYLVDTDSEIADAMGAKTTPHVFVFDAKKKLIYKGSIDNSWDSKRENDEQYLYDVFEAVTNAQKIKNKSTSPRGCSIKRVKK